MWLPLLAVFIWLAWAGWNEYQKLEAYRHWAKPFAKAKYDIYAVLAQDGDRLIWGTPTRRGPVNLQTLSLREVRSIFLLVNGVVVDLDRPPSAGSLIVLELQSENSETVQIPFTEIALAVEWARYLQQELQRLSLE